jgi:putative acetyltransferase
MIRPYEPADEDALLDVWLAASVLAHDFVPESFWADERQAIVEQYMPIAETHVAVMGGAVIGFSALIDNELGALFVHPDRQGRGVGAALLLHAVTLRPDAVLTLGVFQKNPRAKKFYETHGFIPVGEETEPRTGETIVRMELRQLF